MRINEFANAEEQLALWKLVSDNMWQALSTQAEQQARGVELGLDVAKTQLDREHEKELNVMNKEQIQQPKE